MALENERKLLQQSGIAEVVSRFKQEFSVREERNQRDRNPAFTLTSRDDTVDPIEKGKSNLDVTNDRLTEPQTVRGDGNIWRKLLLKKKKRRKKNDLV